MVININPNRINSPGSKVAERRRQQDSERGEIIVPAKASVNFIPSPESLGTMIRGAVEALRRGIFWDRGTILNVLV